MYTDNSYLLSQDITQTVATYCHRTCTHRQQLLTVTGHVHRQQLLTVTGHVHRQQLLTVTGHHTDSSYLLSQDMYTDNSYLLSQDITQTVATYCHRTCTHRQQLLTVTGHVHRQQLLTGQRIFQYWLKRLFIAGQTIVSYSSTIEN